MMRNRGPLPRLFISCGALVWLLAWSATAGSAQVGRSVADFSLSDTSGEAHTLGTYLDSGNTVVLDFWSFKCPVSLAYDERLAALQSKYRGRGVVVLAIASNSNESAADIQRNASNLKLAFPVLLDADGQVAESLGATHTPQIFIIDKDSMLRYKGSFDNNKHAGEGGRVAYAEEALDAILGGRTVQQPETRVFGCSIRRRGF